jgi:uncharacterized protein
MGEATRPSPNPLAWWEIQVPDLEAGQAFYGVVFGGRSSRSATASSWRRPPTARWSAVSTRRLAMQVYLRTDDLEATLSAAEAAGGTVVQPRTLISEEHGWFATLADPSGIQIGVDSDKLARAAGPAT